MTESEVAELVALTRRGQPQARTELMESHRRIVARIAQRYSESDLSSEERVRLGEQSLVQAIDQFELSQGFRFSTYATWHIQRAILGGMNGGGGHGRGT